MTVSPPRRASTPGVRFEGALVIHEDLEARVRARKHEAQSPPPEVPSTPPSPATRSSVEEAAIAAVAIPAIVVEAVVAKTVVFPAIGAAEVAKEAAGGDRAAQAILLYVAALFGLGIVGIAIPKLWPLVLLGMVAAFPIALWVRWPR